MALVDSSSHKRTFRRILFDPLRLERHPRSMSAVYMQCKPRQVIYARCSTDKQVLENQTLKLTELYPAAEVFTETASGAKQRPVLKELLLTLKEGDQLIVYELSRLGRKTVEILALVEELSKRGIILKSVRENLDLGSIAGRLVCSILISINQMEREVLGERTRLGLEARRKQGVRLGAPPRYTKIQLEQVKQLRAEGKRLKEIAELTGISISHVSRLLKYTTQSQQADSVRELAAS